MQYDNCPHFTILLQLLLLPHGASDVATLTQTVTVTLRLFVLSIKRDMFACLEWSLVHVVHTYFKRTTKEISEQGPECIQPMLRLATCGSSRRGPALPIARRHREATSYRGRSAPFSVITSSASV
jgi:hypothetical protein